MFLSAGKTARGQVAFDAAGFPQGIISPRLCETPVSGPLLFMRNKAVKRELKTVKGQT